MTLSAVLITKNEATNIGPCLASLGFAQEIIVLDSGSTDDTVVLARSVGAQVHVSEDWPGFGVQKNRALALATGDWVLSIDADERVTPALQAQILAAIASGQADCYRMPRLSSYCGQHMRHGGWFPDPVERLFRRGTARFSDDVVHERLLPQGKVGELTEPLLHDSFKDFDAVLDKVNRYSSASAAALYARGRRASFFSAFTHGCWAFVRTYLLRRGFLDGRMGLALAISNAQGSYYRYLKLWLLGQHKP